MEDIQIEDQDCSEEGYNQPDQVFTYQGRPGRFYDRSCGRFGSRYWVDWNQRWAVFGSLVEDSGPISNFREEEDRDFLLAFERAFDLAIPSKEEREK